jgi:hypothetical protein
MRLKILLAVLVLFWVLPLKAITVTYTATSSASPADGPSFPFIGQAAFTFLPGELDITLTNLSPHTKSAGETLRGVTFTLSGVSGGTIVSSSGYTRKVTSTTSFTDSALPISSDWALVCSGSVFTLAATGSDLLVIGPPEVGSGEYDYAVSSVTNSTHRLHFRNSPTFKLSIPGLTSSTQLSNVLIGFGTGSANAPGPRITTAMPLPTALPSGLALLAVVGLMGWARNRRRQEASQFQRA